MKTLSINEAAQAAGVTTMTIYNWRNQRQDPLPSNHVLPKRGGGRPRVRIPAQEFRRWARRNGVVLG